MTRPPIQYNIESHTSLVKLANDLDQWAINRKRIELPTESLEAAVKVIEAYLITLGYQRINKQARITEAKRIADAIGKGVCYICGHHESFHYSNTHYPNNNVCNVCDQCLEFSIGPSLTTPATN